MKYLIVLFFSVGFIWGCSNPEINEKQSDIVITQKKRKPNTNIALAKPSKIKIELGFDRSEIQIGNATISDDKRIDPDGKNNLLSGYLIFGKDFTGHLNAEVYNAQGNVSAYLTKITGTCNFNKEGEIVGKKNEIQLVQFHFFHVKIDSSCTVGINEIVI